MKTTSPLTGLLVAVITTGSLFSSCKKNDDASGTAGKTEFATMSAQSDAAAEMVFEDVFDNTMGVSAEVGIGGTGVFGRVAVTPGSTNRMEGVDSTACYSVVTKQLSTLRFPLQITIDFGGGCTARDGRTRKGKIIIVYTGHLAIPGNSATATFDGYSIDNVKVEGTHKLTNTGTTDKKSYTTQVINAKLSQANGNYVLWNSEKTIAQVEGGATPLIGLDDVYSITGQSGGSVQIDSKYFQWSTAIITPLTKKFSCRWISRGTLSLKKGNDAVAVLDYGSGACDNKASFTVNGQVQEITLH
ncbi:hypothetical protein [Niastella sp. OAS944]|uniref:hypothetical protein n=1 Tax=Niastella sp. OAS944 TaxID=2664089 RepID=UPI00347C4501|nr:hypothetical protein [Chitinophagaceae bacterium OAS944]